MWPNKDGHRANEQSVGSAQLGAGRRGRRRALGLLRWRGRRLTRLGCGAEPLIVPKNRTPRPAQSNPQRSMRLVCMTTRKKEACQLITQIINPKFHTSRRGSARADNTQDVVLHNSSGFFEDEEYPITRNYKP